MCPIPRTSWLRSQPAKKSTVPCCSLAAVVQSLASVILMGINNNWGSTTRLHHHCEESNPFIVNFFSSQKKNIMKKSSRNPQRTLWFLKKKKKRGPNAQQVIHGATSWQATTAIWAHFLYHNVHTFTTKFVATSMSCRLEVKKKKAYKRFIQQCYTTGIIPSHLHEKYCAIIFFRLVKPLVCRPLFTTATIILGFGSDSRFMLKWEHILSKRAPTMKLETLKFAHKTF